MSRKRALRVPDYLEHMLDAISRIQDYVSQVGNEREFQSNHLVQDAVVRNLEVLGEAAQNIKVADPDFARRNSEVPWDLIYGMRNRIIHGYFDINLEVVWQTVNSDLPTLYNQIETLLHDQQR